MQYRFRRRNVVMAILAGIAITSYGAEAQREWISLCGQCLSPSISSKAGIGTAHATAEGKITRQDAMDWCANWSPGDKKCVTEQLSSAEAKALYRITADCMGGKIAAADDQTYTLSGVWTSDVGRGRVRFKDASGANVGQDEASGGLAIAQQWETLCPGVTSISSRFGASAAMSPNSRGAATPGETTYSIGQTVEAKYAGQWVPGSITGIRQAPGKSAGELNYDVSLKRGGRGILPASMIRSIGGETPAVPSLSGSTAQGPSQMRPSDSRSVDPCRGLLRCYNGEVFTAQVKQVIVAQEPRLRIVRMNVVFSNVSNAPIILGYVAKSSTIIDNQGNAFYPAAGGAADRSVQGMGIVSAGNADTSFVLHPGESRNATFQLFRRADRTVIGTAFSWNATIAQLRILPNGQQVNTIREYSVNVPDLRP